MAGDKIVELGAYDQDRLVPALFVQSDTSLIGAYVLEFGKTEVGKSHFQSLKRLPEYLGGDVGRYVYVTGNDKDTRSAYLFIIEMGSRAPCGPWGNRTPAFDGNDKVIRKIKLYEHSKQFMHPGGMDICGKYLVIPTENEKAHIDFYDISDPKNPSLLEKASFKSSSWSCMACALARLADGHYLLCGIRSGGELFFHYSKTIRLEDGFFSEPTAVVSKASDASAVAYNLSRGYQNINFVTSDDGILFMVGTQNTAEAAPVFNGDDYADLAIVEYDPAVLAKINDAMANKRQRPNLKGPAIAVRLLRQKHMFCQHSMCNFNAGATLYTPNEKSMSMYSIHHWLSGGNPPIVRMGVFQ